MAAYIVRRLLVAVPLLVVISFIVFFLSRAGGRDPVSAIVGERASSEARERAIKEFGLDKPLIVQYGRYLAGIVTRGDFGVSYVNQGRSVSQQLATYLPPTLELTLAAMGIALILGIAAGVLSAVYSRSWVDYLATGISLFGVSIPVFWLGLLLILGFGSWLPYGGNLDPTFDVPRRTGFMILDCALSGQGPALRDALLRLILPACTLATIPLAMTARITRASMLEVLGSDYVRTARAKGLTPGRVVMKHAFRNALIPVVTLVGLEFGYLLGGAVLTETVFAWPGMGSFLVASVLDSDPMSVCGAAMVITALFILVNLAVDVTYAFIDPRIHYA
jgi:peptide/nickel transport system permease protein